MDDYRRKAPFGRKPLGSYSLEMRVGAVCHAGGRRLQIEAPNQVWLDWALNTLYAQAEREKMGAGHEARRHRV